MKKRIDDQYIEQFNEKIDGIKKEVPMMMIKPQENDSKIGIIFLNGLNGTISMISYFNFDVMKDKYLISFDNRAQGQNFNYASSNYKKYLNDAKLIIEFIIQKYENVEHWFLIGESWGGALCALLTKESLNAKIKGFFFWNMPCKIVNTNPRTGWNAFVANLKVTLTYLTKISFKIDNPANKQLTNNKVLFKLIKLNESHPINTGVIIACWKTFKPAWKSINNSKNITNFHYVQSHDDVLKDEKMIQQLKKYHSHNMIEFDSGTHILSFDIYQDEKLFHELNLFINKSLKIK